MEASDTPDEHMTYMYFKEYSEKLKCWKSIQTKRI